MAKFKDISETSFNKGIVIKDSNLSPLKNLKILAFKGYTPRGYAHDLFCVFTIGQN